VDASLDFGEILALSLQPVRLAALSDDSAALIYACAAFYQERQNWRVLGQKPNDSEWQQIMRLIGKMETELMNELVGLIYPHALGVIVGMPFLPCDGAIYARSDYPILYSKIDPVYIVDADYFRVPDMRDRFMLGESATRALDDTGGLESVTLSVSEMPAHTHTNLPHSHGEITALPALADLGTGVPVPSATPAIGTTSPQSIVIDNAGGGLAHENMPPFVVIRWAIVAG